MAKAMDVQTARTRTLSALFDETFDVAIIGGGITGAGIARDAVLRGLKVALVDKSDFGAGTSSKSSKLIHGGLRYLQHAAFGLVFESISERTRLLRLAPHLVRPLSFLAPAYKGQYPGLFTLDCGLWIYDAMSRFNAPKRHQTYRQRRLLELEPGLSENGLRGGIVYYDSMTDDARLTLENVIDARDLGAKVASYVQVVGFVRGAAGEVHGLRIQDLLDPEKRTGILSAKVVVNATGPWSDGLLRLLAEDNTQGPLLRPTKGIHVVVDQARLPVRHAVVMSSPKDGRVLFAIPWSDEDAGAGGRTVIGTTDTDYIGDPDLVAADAADVEYLLSCANHYFPKAELAKEDVLSTWAGLRPLIAPSSHVQSASAVSREHRIVNRGGLITIAGGKLTTYRRMAGQVMDVVVTHLGKSPDELPCKTQEAPLPGAKDLPDGGIVGLELALSAQSWPWLDKQVVRHLCRTYGSQALQLSQELAQGDEEDRKRLDPEQPYLYGEIDVAVHKQEALRLEDVLGRRLPLLLRGRDQGLGCVQRVALRMGKLLGWSKDVEAAEVARYHSLVALSRQHLQPGK